MLKLQIQCKKLPKQIVGEQHLALLRHFISLPKDPKWKLLNHRPLMKLVKGWAASALNKRMNQKRLNSRSKL